jgi:hypothetical protein
MSHRLVDVTFVFAARSDKALQKSSPPDGVSDPINSMTEGSSASSAQKLLRFGSEPHRKRGRQRAEPHVTANQDAEIAIDLSAGEAVVCSGIEAEIASERGAVGRFLKMLGPGLVTGARRVSARMRLQAPSSDSFHSGRHW